MLKEVLLAFADCYQQIVQIKAKISANRDSEKEEDDFLEQYLSGGTYGEENCDVQGEESQREKEPPKSTWTLCQLCKPCTFKTLHLYNMHVAANPSLYNAYK